KDIPNLICVLRIILVFPVVTLILNGDYVFALILFVIAGLSDGLDGFLAKHYHWQSRLGSILDPLADKLLLVSTYIVMSYVGLIPVWLVVAAFARDIIIVSGGFAYHKFIGPFEMAPSFISKFNTFMQILLIAGVLSRQLTEIPLYVIDWMVIATLVTIVLSGMDYVMVWGKRALLTANTEKLKQKTRKSNSNE
ncbi:MAG: CDP-alcohol phosphatidyltransferase family protein, partial [Gammaproteobacteria bacterium]|nr:CDP-alcohol phosphatidyltransferase family protein [Gammaproteobacteria bacterium]